MLALLPEMDIDINAQCTDGSKVVRSRAMDIACNNKSPTGVKPEILKLLIQARASMEPAAIRPPIFAAAGTGNLACCNLLVEARVDVNVWHNKMNLALYYNYSSALRSTLHLSIRR